MGVQGGGVGLQQSPELHTDLSICVDQINRSSCWESAEAKCVWENEVERGTVQFKEPWPVRLLGAKHPW